jgi:alpha-amylase/alpha-mannosidase (GH57 family)
MTGVNILWHMHQPDYRPAGSRQALLPWVRLHAVRGYLDMLSSLEAHPDMRCTVNFSGILLEQLLHFDTEPLDYWGELSLKPVDSLSGSERGFIVEHFFSANVDMLIRPQTRYAELHGKREQQSAEQSWEERAAAFDAQELTDLIVWFNLAWIGFTGRKREDVQALFNMGSGFTHADQQRVIEIHRELTAQVLPGYRQLADAGNVELSFTPYHHPILPLLHDLSGVGTQVEGDPLPEYSYAVDAAAHVQRGMQLFEQAFGRSPVGAWPAEGSVSDAALTTLADAGVRWVATDQQNLTQGELAHLTPWRWQLDGGRVLVYFRDTQLADNVGFDYCRWDPHDAARHLCDNIAALGAQSPHERTVVSVILDGENPWENYFDGGEAFLHQLYTELTSRDDLEMVTPSRLLDDEWPTLDSIKPGSWIMGNFDIWSKDAEARQAWRLLTRAREELDDVIGGADTPVCRDPQHADKSVCATVMKELLAAEASDWFWWYGDTFQSDQKAQFDALFRGHLIRAYELAGREVPPELCKPIG